MAYHDEMSDRDLIVRIDERTQALDKKFEDLFCRLYGNGQPGEIQRINEYIDDLRTQSNLAKGTLLTAKWLIGVLGLAQIAVVGRLVWNTVFPAVRVLP
jgi:hypothetical protein